MCVCVCVSVLMSVPKVRLLPCAVLLLVKELKVPDELGVGIQVKKGTWVRLCSSFPSLRLVGG